MGLLTPAYKKKTSEEKTRKIIRRIESVTDRDKLAEIISEAYSESVAEAALRQMTERERFAYAAGNRNRTYKAAEMISDQDLLYRLATEAESEFTRKKAFGRLRDVNRQISVFCAGGMEMDKAFAQKLALMDDEQQIVKVLSVAQDLKEDIRMSLLSVLRDPSLAQIVREARDGHIRRDAVLCLKDQEILAEIARRGEEGSAAAVQQLADPDALADIAATTQSSDLQLECTMNPHLTDPAVLAMLLLKSNEKRNYVLAYFTFQKPDFIKALEKDRSPKALADVPLMNGQKEPNIRDKSIWIRLLALADERYDDMQRISADLRNASDEAITWLAGAARSGPVRAAATARLTDEKPLVKAALKDRDPRVRKAAVSNPNMTDSQALLKISREDADPSVRREAILNRNFPDSEVLAEFVQTETDPAARSAAAANAHLRDTALLARLATEDGETKVRKAAVENPNLTDPVALKKLALEDKNSEIRIAAILNPALKDQDLLESLARYKDPEKEAGEMLKIRENVYIMMTDFKGVEVRQIRNAAVQRLESPEVLEQILASEQVENICWTAALRLSEIDPSRAVSPLVKMMQQSRERYVDKKLRQKAVAFLQYQYREAKESGDRDLIRTLPNGYYGTSRGPSCSHDDSTVHFDLGR